MALVGRCII